MTADDEAGEKDEVGEGQEGETDPEIQQEMMIEGWAVGAGVGREPPGCEQKRSMRVVEARRAGQGHGVRISRPV